MVQFDKNFWIFTLEEYEQLPDGIELTSITGNKVIKGKDYIDLDVRFGCIAYGVKNPREHEHGELFTTFILKQ